MRHEVVILGQTFALSSGQGAGPGNLEPPEWILVLPEGVNRIEEGQPFLVDAEAARLVLASFKDASHDMVIDYEHQTMTGGEAPAAGWIKTLEWRTDGEKPGLWAKVDWTARAAGLIRAKEYRYHSPVLIIRRESDNRVARLHNVALTNQPRLLDAPALAAKYTLNLHEGDEDMKNLEALKKALGLDAGLSGDQAEAAVLKAVADLKTGKDKAEGDLVALKQAAPGKAEDLVACKEVLTALGLAEGADKAKVVGAVEALKAPATASGELAKQVEVLKVELGGLKAEGLISEALKSGKTSPAELDAWGRKMAQGQPEQFKLVVLARADGSVVPLKAVGAAPDAPACGVLTEEQRKINEQMGITEEVWLKHNPKAEA
jgi:phage I-like protein